MGSTEARFAGKHESGPPLTQRGSSAYSGRRNISRLNGVSPARLPRATDAGADRKSSFPGHRPCPNGRLGLRRSQFENVTMSLSSKPSRVAIAATDWPRSSRMPST